MQRSSVLFPDPERPRRATISPSRRSSEMSSRTGSGLPSGETNVLVTCDTSMMVVGWAPGAPTPGCVVTMRDHSLSSPQPGATPTRSHREPALGQRVEAAPDEPVHDNDEGAHDDAPRDQEGELPPDRCRGNVVAEPVGMEGVAVPAHELGHDRRVPRPSGRRDPPGD